MERNRYATYDFKNALQEAPVKSQLCYSNLKFETTCRQVIRLYGSMLLQYPGLSLAASG